MANTKPFWQSRELIVVFLALVNYGLNHYGFPSIEPTPEFYAGVVAVIGFVRGYFTQAGIRWSFN